MVQGDWNTVLKTYVIKNGFEGFKPSKMRLWKQLTGRGRDCTDRDFSYEGESGAENEEE
jgi:hypothetical protein